MRIDNCIRIVDGVLRTTPSIDAYERVVFESQKVLRGDLFIDLLHSKENLKEAIQNGAYAIISTLNFKGEDEEIAWIQVEKIEQSLIKLLRYTITHKNLRFISATQLQSAFLEMLHFPKSIKFLKGSLEENALSIFKAKDNDTLCLNDTVLLKDIAPHALHIEESLHVSTFSSKGLFLSSFFIQETYYTDQKIPTLFLPILKEVLDFCEEHNFTYELDALNYTDHFYPQFVTPSLRKKEFGGSDKVFIFESNAALIMEEITYIKALTPSASLIVCVPIKEEIPFTCNVHILSYKDPEDLKILRQSAFQYALILGERELFEPFLAQTFTIQPSLF